jgi:site-specific recombinase XerD
MDYSNIPDVTGVIYVQHTFATRLIELGVDILTVSKLLGHSDFRTTMIYAKVGVSVLRDAVERLNSMMVRFW